MTERAFACDCPLGECRNSKRQEICEQFLARVGDVHAQWCEYCRSYTWHQNGDCLKIDCSEMTD